MHELSEAGTGRIAWGGKPVFGARLGILMLEARFPRIPGDMCNAATWPFPVLGDEERLDVAAAERDVLAAGDALVARHAGIGAVVLECTNMAPYARALQQRRRLPVFDIYAFATWFHAGLVPRDFGPPGSGPRDWRER
jgi:hypothetical protein